MHEFEVSRRTVARDLDYLRDEENAPLVGTYRLVEIRTLEFTET